MYITRNSKCVLCKKTFDWWLWVIEENDVVPENPGVQASTFYLTEHSAMGSYGRGIEYEAIVLCPHCSNNNKFIGRF